MVAPAKTSGAAYIAWQNIASAVQVIGASQDVSVKWAAAFAVALGRGTGTAFTAGWPNVRIEGSVLTSGNDSWKVLANYQMALGASIVNTTLNGAITAGATSMVVTSATNIAVGDYIFLEHTTDVTKYELVRVAAVSGTTITFEEACTYAHDNGAAVRDQSESAMLIVDCSTLQRVRAVVDNAGSGQAIRAEVKYATFDSFG